MGRHSKILAYAAVFFVAVEVGLRLAMATGTDVEGRNVSSQGPVILLLGSSRTARGLVPAVISATLESAGIDDAFVANIAARGPSMIGLYRNYDSKLHPHVASSDLPEGWLGIEVRGEALTEEKLGVSEASFVQSMEWPPATKYGSFEAETPDSVREMTRGEPIERLAFDLESASRSALEFLAVVRARREWIQPMLVRFVTQRLSPGALPQGPTTNSLRLERALVEAGERWAGGARGFERVRRPRRPDLGIELNREHYEQKLAEYRTGGRSSATLRALIWRARMDGLRVFLYVMPVSAVHRTYYPEGAEDEFRRELGRISRLDQVPVFDLDTSHTMPLESFWDTHHLLSSAAESLSVDFARDVIGPLLRIDDVPELPLALPPHPRDVGEPLVLPPRRTKQVKKKRRTKRPNPR